MAGPLWHERVKSQDEIKKLRNLTIGGQKFDIKTYVVGFTKSSVKSLTQAAIEGGTNNYLQATQTGDLQRALDTILKEINQKGTTVVLITHDASIAQHANRTLHIQDGNLV